MSVVIEIDIDKDNLSMGDSSVLYAYLFLSLFGQVDNIYKVEQDSLYFFLQGGFRGNFKGKQNSPFYMWFQSYDVWKDRLHSREP